MRTYIYHEILISYLDYVRKRGFSTVHIWACPPGKGDDYILYAKPEDQKTPKDDRLKSWYYKMLEKAQERSIVGKITNMHEIYFANAKNDATIVPYMEGDYFPGEVENCIRDMEEGKHSKKATSDGKKKKKAKKSKSGRKGTRSSGVDEEALAASGILPAGYDQKGMEQGDQDFVMKKLGQIIEPMKESFIVAFLTWEGAKEENLVVPKDVVELRKKYDKSQAAKAIEVGKKAPAIAQSVNSDPDAAKSTTNGDVKMEDNSALAPEDKDDANKDNNTEAGSNAMDTNDGKANSDIPESTTSNADGDKSTPDTKNGPSEDGQAKEKADLSDQVISPDEVKKKLLAVQRDGKFAAMEARKRTIEGTPKPQETKSVDPEKRHGL